jgi:hypothetical protein
MGRGINSRLIQIRPGRAQNMTLQRLAPGQQRRNYKTISLPERGGSIGRGLCRESSLRQERDAENSRTLA